VTWYRSTLPLAARSLLLWVQGSGCQPLFRLRGDGHVVGGYQNLLRGAAAHAGIRVIAIEKPGVGPFEVPLEKGTAFTASPAFQREHTFPRWVEALHAVLGAAIGAEEALERIGVLGHSEGALAAAAVAGRDLRVSHLGLLGFGGMTGLAERLLLELSGVTHKPPDGVDVSADESCRRNVETLAQEIMNDPESTERLAWGHPFARWSTFGTRRIADELKRSTCDIFIAHGERDDQVPLASFCALAGDLWAAGRFPRLVVVPDADHGFRTAALAGHDGMLDIFRKFIDWLLR
jgi:pimeloyl-ACP methyl ester carboxylesterase